MHVRMSGSNDALKLWDLRRQQHGTEVCAYANNQWAVHQEIGADPATSSFVAAWLCVRAVLAVLVSCSSQVSSEPWGGRLALCPSWTEMQCATRDAFELSMPRPATQETATEFLAVQNHSKRRRTTWMEVFDGMRA